MTQSHHKRKNYFVEASMDDQELLPNEVIFDIFSRLPVETIILCKCVCKKWQNLLSDSYFAYLHLSRSPHEGLLISHYSFSDYSSGATLEFWKWEEIYHQHNLLINNDPFICSNLNVIDRLPERVELLGSVNGLICLWDFDYDDTYVCNPMIGKGEYMLLPKHQFYALAKWEVRYGFGVSVSRKYKVVRIFSNKAYASRNLIKVEVYTLGTDQWRTLDQVSSCLRGKENHGLFFNGHVYWILGDHQLYRFDFDNETFQLLPPPRESRSIHQFLGVLRGCLARIYTSSSRGISIWTMKEHGVKTSWHEELVIKNSICGLEPKMWDPLCFIDGLNGTTILVVHAKHLRKLLAYCHETNTVVYCHETNTVEEMKLSYRSYVTTMTYRPSFLTLHNIS